MTASGVRSSCEMPATKSICCCARRWARREDNIIKATLESLAYQTKDILNAMQEDAGLKLKSLKVDGGASANNVLMQFQADILGAEVERPEVIESTAMGAAYFAGIQCGLWKKDDIVKNRRVEKCFKPAMDDATRDRLYGGWQKAVKRTMGWGLE